MRAIKSFEEFIEIGTVKKISPDMARARSLINEAEKRMKFVYNMLGKIKISNENANYYIENSYDTLIELARAILLIDGLKASGEGAHEAEVIYLIKMGIVEKDVRFMNDLRYYRNGILYYGKEFDSEYGSKVIEFLNKLYPQLKTLIKEKVVKK